MNSILITGGRGFLGRNLAARLHAVSEWEPLVFDLDDHPAKLPALLARADVIYHLAGVNRPRDVREYESGNTGFTLQLCNLLRQAGRRPRVVFSSSVQAALDNPYGVSKLRAETALLEFAADAGAAVRIYRLKNLFGKWCRPNYNSVTATFCYNVANGLPLRIEEPEHRLELTYVDDVVDAFLLELPPDAPRESGLVSATAIPSVSVTVGELAERIRSFHAMRLRQQLPDFCDEFNRRLYATYLSHVPAAAREIALPAKRDTRGALVEFIKSPSGGQIFVSRTAPGVTRGNHYHHTKTEKFLVVEGEGLLRMRQVDGDEVVEYRLHGGNFQVVDIPPGFTHSIQNLGRSEMVTLFWASEVFDPQRPDTYACPVDQMEEHLV